MISMIVPTDFHTLAENLVYFNELVDQVINRNPTNVLASTNNECIFRTIIDRAYYSAFLEARLWSKGLTFLMEELIQK